MAPGRRFYRGCSDRSAPLVVVDPGDVAGHVRRDDGAVRLDDDQRLGRHTPPAAVDHVGRDDGRHDAAVGVADVGDVRHALTQRTIRPPTFESSVLVFGRIRDRVGGVQRGSDHPAANTGRTALPLANDGTRESQGERRVACPRGCLSGDAAQARLPPFLPLAYCIPIGALARGGPSERSAWASTTACTASAVAGH